MTNAFFFAAQGKSLDTLWKVKGMLIAKPHWKKRRVLKKHKFLQCTYFNDRVCARRGLSKSFATGRVIYLSEEIWCWGRGWGRGAGRRVRKKVVWLLTCTELINSCPLELLLTGGRGTQGSWLSQEWSCHAKEIQAILTDVVGEEWTLDVKKPWPHLFSLLLWSRSLPPQFPSLFVCVSQV